MTLSFGLCDGTVNTASVDSFIEYVVDVLQLTSSLALDNLLIPCLPLKRPVRTRMQGVVGAEG